MTDKQLLLDAYLRMFNIKVEPTASAEEKRAAILKVAPFFRISDSN